jgi:hypothetical protein
VSALAPLLSLSPTRGPVGQPCRRRSSCTRARFSLCPAEPTYQSVPNLLPTSLAVDAPTTECSPATFSSPHLFRRRTLLAHFPPLTCTLNRTLLPPLSLCARDQVAPPPLTEDHHSFYDRRRARAPSIAAVSSASPSATRDTLWFALPLSGFPGPRTPEHFLRSRSPPPSTQGSTTPPPFPKHPEVRSRGEQPSHAFISLSIVPVPAQFLAGVDPRRRSPPRRVLHPLVPSCQFCAHGRVRQIALSTLELFPKPLEPRYVQSSRLRRDFTAGLSGARARPPAVGSGAPSEIGRFRINQKRSNLSPSI